MKLKEMKRIAKSRSVLSFTHDDFDIDDFEFLAMAANSFDKLLAVVDAARYVYGTEREGFSPYEVRIGIEAMRQLYAALENLEK